MPKGHKEMRKLSATARIVISLVCISTSLLLIAGTLGIFPNRQTDVMQGRVRLSESLALSFSTMAAHTNTQTMTSFFTAVVERNPDIVSIGLRKDEGILLLLVGDHEQHWEPSESDKSSETQLVVPVNAATGRWGKVEIRF